MSPIIVFVENGKIVMTPNEFKTYMNEAYTKGYTDGSSITYSSTSNTTPWWETIKIDANCVTADA